MCEDYPRRMETCVSVTDDNDVPELEFIPDLTPEEKELNSLKMTKDLTKTLK